MFIDGKKYRQLMEAKNNGDEKAKAILLAQYKNDDGLEDLLNDYFKVGEEKEPEEEIEKEVINEEPKKDLSYEEKLEKFLSDNGVKPGDEDYDSMVEEFKKETPQVETQIEIHSEEEPECECDYIEGIEILLADEIEAVKGYDKQILVIANSDLPDSMKKGIIASYNEIKDEELKHIEELKKIKLSIEKKEEKI